MKRLPSQYPVNKPLWRTFTLSLLILITTQTRSDDGLTAEVMEIAPDVYVRQGQHQVVFEGQNIANIGFVVGERCIAVIDTGGSYEEGKALLRAIREVSELPVCYVINTHGHPDHIFGNLAFRDENTRFVGHAKLPRVMALSGETYLRRATTQAGYAVTSDHLVVPDILIEDSRTLDLGGRSLLLHAEPPAHSIADLVILDEATSTLWLSDLLFVQHIPIITGSLNGWLWVLDKLETVSVERVVPGHGPVSVTWPEGGTDQRRYLTLMQLEMRQLIKEGGTLEEARITIGKSESERWQLFNEYHKRNVISAYTELEWE